MRSSARVTAVSLAMACVVLGIAGLAWACTPQATISLIPRSARAGEPVTVNGSRFEDTPVEIRWNDAGGPLLAVASGPEFSVQITAPADAADGVYFVVATDGTPGSFSNRVSDALEINGRSSGDASLSTAGLWTGFSRSTAAAGLEPAGSNPGARGTAAGPAGIVLTALAGAGVLAVLAGRIKTTRARRRA